MVVLFRQILCWLLLFPGLTKILAAKRSSPIYAGGYYEEELVGDDNGEEYVPAVPCKVVRPGDPDLTTYDVISSYRFDELHYEFQGVHQVSGSSGFQTAYHIQSYSNTTIEAEQAFPMGVPNEFSFESTFRVSGRQPLNEWFLFELSDYRRKTLMSLAINPIYKTVDFSLRRQGGAMQTVTFEGIEIADRSWHKIMLAVEKDSARLWIDCRQVPDRHGAFRAAIDVRVAIDSGDGTFSVARDHRTQETVPIDLQWMIFSCDAEKPTRTDCREIQHTGSTHERTQWMEDVCPEQCPRGPPGIPGMPGLPGPPAAPFEHHDRFYQKGEKGEPGLPGVPARDGFKGEPGRAGMPGRNGSDGSPGLPGPQGPPGAVKVTAHETSRLPGLPGPRGEIGPPGHAGAGGPPGVSGAKGDTGPVGPPGRPGATGTAGERGEPGVVGAMGYPGIAGPMGPMGPAGPPGPPGNTDIISSATNAFEVPEIREICFEVVREYLSEMSATLIGPPGPAGSRGIGKPGPPGQTGLQGEPGLRGPPGERGYPGVPGVPGQQGEVGPPGPQGSKGERGYDGTGHEGPMGPPGLQGPEGRGLDGLPGRPGERGDTGRPGEPGQRGPPGQPGVCPDCAAYQAAYSYAYPFLINQQQSNKGPQNYNDKG